MLGTTPNSLPIGTLLGNFKVLKTLGHGGFGITYLAHDTQLKRNVVLKECFPAGISVRDPQTGQVHPINDEFLPHYQMALEALKEEARTLARLNHENIVRVYEVFESNGCVFYAMPWLQGGDLVTALYNTDIPTIKLEEWLVKLLNGLSYLHENGIYHRDIKPQNILFDEKSNPVLIDFGSALSVHLLTQTATQGSFSWFYASPEQLSGKGEIGPWTDFYSLAGVWYELISKHRPETCIERLVKDEVRPLRLCDEAKAFSKDFIGSIDFNLSLKPENRCQSAHDWLRWLNTAQAPKRKYHSKKLFYVITAASVFLLSFLTLCDSSQYVPAASKSSQKNLQVLEEKLYQKAYKLTKVDELKARRKRFHDELNEDLKLIEKKLARLQSTAKAMIAQAVEMKKNLRTPDDCSHLTFEEQRKEQVKRDAFRDSLDISFRKWESDFDRLQEETRNFNTSLINKWSRQIVYFNREFYLSDITEKFPISSSDEMSLLPRVQDRLWSKYSHLYHTEEIDKAIQMIYTKLSQLSSKVNDDIQQALKI